MDDRTKREQLSKQIEAWLRESKGIVEKRSLAAPLQSFSISTGEKIGTVAGYVAKFNELSVEMGTRRETFREVLAPGCFRNLGDDIKALFSHDDAKILGRTGNGTLRLRQDNVGLYAEIDLADVSHSRDLLAIVKRLDAPNCSFGFIMLEDRWDNTPQGKVRTVLGAQLLEVSVGVTWPAYKGASVSARNKADTHAKRQALSKQIGEDLRKVREGSALDKWRKDGK